EVRTARRAERYSSHDTIHERTSPKLSARRSRPSQHLYRSANLRTGDGENFQPGVDLRRTREPNTESLRFLLYIDSTPADRDDESSRWQGVRALQSLWTSRRKSAQ